MLTEIPIGAGIYQLTNKVNGKSYIGSTKNFRIRIAQHKSKRSCCVKLKAAIQKYGVDNFEFNVLESVNSDNPIQLDGLLKEREQYFLDKLQPFDSYGYNIHRTSNGVGGTSHSAEYKQSISGQNSKVAKQVRQYNMDGQYECTYSTIRAAALANPPASVQTIIRCCNGLSISTGGKMWSYNGHSPPIPRTRYKGRTVIQLNSNNEIIREFPSIKEAAIHLGCSSSNVLDCCTGRIQTSKIGIWIYKDEYVISEN